MVEEQEHRRLCDAGWQERGYGYPRGRPYYCDGFRDGQAAERTRHEAAIAAARGYLAAYYADTDADEKAAREALRAALTALDTR